MAHQSWCANGSSTPLVPRRRDAGWSAVSTRDVLERGSIGRLLQHLSWRVSAQISGVALRVQHLAEAVGGGERVWMPITEGLALQLERITQQPLSGSEVALGMQQLAEGVGGEKRVRVH